MKKLIPWLGAAAMLVVIFGTIYTVVQQSQRNDANYPQIQIAEDTAAALNQGQRPTSLARGRVNINSSLTPFTIIYDKAGHVVAGSGYLNDSIPTIPYGVLTAAKGNSYNFVTWQPQSDVRIAAVSFAANNYYVLSGRSLKEVETNERQTFQNSVMGGIASIIILSALFIIMRKIP